MAQLISNFFGDLNGFIQSSQVWYLAVLPILEPISLVVSAILLYGIIYCIIKSGFLFIQLDKWIDALGIKNLPERRAARGWRRILKRLKDKDPAQWKLAINEADKIVDEIVKHMNIKAETMDERLEQVNASQLSNIEEIKSAHQVSVTIKKNPEFELSLEESKRLINIYAKAFREFNLID